MATITWTGAAGDNQFATPGNWAGGVVPGSGDEAVILQAVTVQSSGQEAANTLTLGAQTRVVVVGQFSIVGGSANDADALSTNAGTITISDNSQLAVGGTIDNTGAITVSSAGNYTDLVVTGPTVLEGGGTVTLGDGPYNRLYGNAQQQTLDNVDNTISGAGQLGLGQLALTNGGIIDATGSNALLLNTSSDTNTGTLEATSGAGGLVIQTAVANAGGLIKAAGATVHLQGGAITGGTIDSVGTSAVQVDYGYNEYLYGGTGGATIIGGLAISDNATLRTADTIVNRGTISLGSAGNYTNLVISSVAGLDTITTLTGGGTVSLSDGPYNRIYGDSGAYVLDNVDNTITGSGQLGVGQLTFENAGVVSATGTNALVLNAITTNTGTLEAIAGTGGLVVQNTVANAGGLIEAAGATVHLQNGSDIVGGRVTSTGTSQVQIDSGNTTTLDGTASPVAVSGQLALIDNARLVVDGAIVNTGTIALGSTGNYTDLILGSASGIDTITTLTGGGTVSLSDGSPYNRIYGYGSTYVLDNVDNTITGAGQIGLGQLTFDNAAVVSATGTNALVLNAVTTNTGTLEAIAGTGGLIVESAVANTGGVILAGGATVHLQNGSDIVGGRVASTGTSQVQVDFGNTTTLDGTTGSLAVSGRLAVSDDARLILGGAIVNTGTIALGSAGNYTDLTIGTGASSAAVTLSGGGTVTLSDASPYNRIYGYGDTAADVLDNVDNTITGAGQIGVGQLAFVNQSVVSATGTNALVLSAATTNTGTLEAIAGSGGLVVQSTVANAGRRDPGGRRHRAPRGRLGHRRRTGDVRRRLAGAGRQQHHRDAGRLGGVPRGVRPACCARQRAAGARRRNRQHRDDRPGFDRELHRRADRQRDREPDRRRHGLAVGWQPLQPHLRRRLDRHPGQRRQHDHRARARLAWVSSPSSTSRWSAPPGPTRWC